MVYTLKAFHTISPPLSLGPVWLEQRFTCFEQSNTTGTERSYYVVQLLAKEMALKHTKRTQIHNHMEFNWTQADRKACS